MADAQNPTNGTKTDYRSTVFLPRTDFPMKAGLPQKEPVILARWESEGLYQQIRESRAGREKFIFHDGPPYANGDIHIGHALNHTIKDMVVRTQTLLGKDAPYVPGWDCHGLPIEWKVEEQYRKKKLNKDEVPVREFRAECRAYAQHWVDVQREQLKRLGVSANWAHPYLTMNYHAEATIVSELFKFADTRQLYRGAKPVMWSPVEKTALAEAEIEYEDIVSTQIDVAFEIVESPIPELVGAYAVIWTTTPWTIPVNQGIAYNPGVEYKLVELRGLGFYRDNADPFDVSLHPLLPLLRGTKLLVAKDLTGLLLQRLDAAYRKISLEFFQNESRAKPVFEEPPETINGFELAGTVARHPVAKLVDAARTGNRFDPAKRYERKLQLDDAPSTPAPASEQERDPSSNLNLNSPLMEFYLRDRPLLPGDFVTTDQGTGLVHMAPDHGEDDFELCRAHGIDPVFAVQADGRYREDWAWLGGNPLSVINPKLNAPEGPINSDLREAGALLSAGEFRHSYPHSWRSKAKVIYRCTPQWFIAMDKPLTHLSAESRAEQRWDNEGGADPTGNGDATLRELAMNAIAATRFIPEKGRNRLGSMVEGRPDWVISRQRAWGVPIALFVDRKSGELLVDREVNRRIVEAIGEQGVDAWDAANAAAFLGSRNPDDYEMVTDILDVWFDSGCTHVFTLESGHWPDERWPADLYVEGSDQHRGWFQSSLLESCGTRGRAPYDALLTHGFTMDAKGMKMSKSLGNTISPIDLMKEYGADILRLWALSVDFTEDHRIGKEILAGVADQYRKLRNTFRYLLGALDGFGEADRLDDVAAYPELERYMLHLTGVLDGKLRNAIADYDFNAYVRALTDFCNEDLSAFFFDIRKDVLYCEVNAETGVQTERRRAYRTVLDTLFQALVRWLSPVLVFTSEEVWATRYPEAGSVHLLEWPDVPQVPPVGEGWFTIRKFRQSVNALIEPMRKAKEIGSSNEAEIVAEMYDLGIMDFLTERKVDLAEVCIVSSVRLAAAKPPSDLDRWLNGGANRAFVGQGTSLEYALTASVSQNHKCGRCWRHLPDVPEDGALCGRCEDVLNA